MAGHDSQRDERHVSILDTSYRNLDLEVHNRIFRFLLEFAASLHAVRASQYRKSGVRRMNLDDLPDDLPRRRGHHFTKSKQSVSQKSSMLTQVSVT